MNHWIYCKQLYFLFQAVLFLVLLENIAERLPQYTEIVFRRIEFFAAAFCTFAFCLGLPHITQVIQHSGWQAIFSLKQNFLSLSAWPLPGSILIYRILVPWPPLRVLSMAWPDGWRVVILMSFNAQDSLDQGPGWSMPIKIAALILMIGIERYFGSMPGSWWA